MQIDPNKHLWLVASDAATMNQADEMFRRVRECMIAFERFMNHCTGIDDDDPKLEEKTGEALMQMLQRFQQQYPNPSQFDADMVTLKGMRTQLQKL
jgi:hypothetical protein